MTLPTSVGMDRWIFALFSRKEYSPHERGDGSSIAALEFASDRTLPTSVGMDRLLTSIIDRWRHSPHERGDGSPA